MFVIMSCYDNLSSAEKIPGKHAANIGLAMKHAGVAITVTSLTDVLVFGVGATTVTNVVSLVISLQRKYRSYSFG